MRLKIHLNLSRFPLSDHARFPIEQNPTKTSHVKIPLEEKAGAKFSRFSVREITLQADETSRELIFTPDSKEKVTNAPPPGGFVVI